MINPPFALLPLASLFLFACTLDDAGGDGSTSGASSAEGPSSEGPSSSSSAGETSVDPSPSTTAVASSTDDGAETSSGSTDSGSGSSGTTDSGSGETGDPVAPECIEYCDAFLAHCVGLPDVEAYDDEADCLTTCATFGHGRHGLFAGDTLECRLDHLNFDPNPGPGYYELHCLHAQAHPTSQCV